jgi:hypothetical protein
MGAQDVQILLNLSVVLLPGHQMIGAHHWNRAWNSGLHRYDSLVFP